MPLTAEAPVSSARKGWQLNQHQWLGVVVPLALLFILICAVEITAMQQGLRAQTSETQNLIASTNQVRTLLEYELNSVLYLTSGLVSYIQSRQGNLTAQELDPWLTHLQNHAKNIRNIGIAPNNKITYIYPLAGNEAAMGLYYPDNTEQWPAVKKTILGRTPVLAGPLNLRQGGQGLIYRVPVYLDKTGYWGLVSTVLNFDTLYAAVHERAQQLGIKIAIQDVAPEADKQKVLFGDNDLLLNYSYSLNLNIPGRNWQIISAPAVAPDASQLQRLRLGGWAIALVLSFLFYTFLRSIARQNLILNALDESQYRFSQAFNNSPQGMALITEHGDWVNFNDSLCTILQYSREQLQSLSFYKIIAPEQQARITKIIASNDARDLVKNSSYNKTFSIPSVNNQYDCVLVKSSGRFIDVILSFAPIQAAKDKGSWMVQIVDISHRVAVEKLLQEEAHYNQAILNSVVDSIITINKRGIICSANPATQSIFRCSHSQLLHKHVNYFLQEPHASHVMEKIKNHTDQSLMNTKADYDIVGLRMDGTSFPLELQLSCINRGDEAIFIAVIRDISERKRLDRMKNDFISVVSHELRTPLTAIHASLRLLESGALGTFSDQAKEMLRIAQDNDKKLSLLINDLLDMDKLLAGKMQFDLKAQPIYPLVLQAIDNNSAYAQQYDVELELVTRDDLSEVNVDGDRLQQVLSNLLSNAAKFSPAGSKVEIHIVRTEQALRVEIKDHGVGISPTEQKKLFEKFYQVDSSTTRQKGGTGLGLAISKELMEAMQGNIGVISEEGRGSCFYIELPLIKNS